MPAVESVESRRRDGDQIELEVRVWGVVDDDQAVSEAVPFAPAQYKGLNRQRPSAHKLNGAYDLWQVIFPYTPLELQSEEPGGGDGGGEEDPPEGIIELDGGGATAHITQSLKTVSKTSFVDGLDAPDHKRAIGVAEDSSGVHVEGTDVPIPSGVITVTKHWPISAISGAYQKGVLGLRGKVNAQPFIIDGVTYQPGELQFLYGRASRRGKKKWEWTYAFDYDEEEQIEIVEGKPRVTKKAHHYLWVQYKQDTDAAGKQILMQPKAAFVEQLFTEADFAGILGFGFQEALP